MRTAYSLICCMNDPLCFCYDVFQIKSMKLVAILDVAFLGGVIALTLLAFHGSFRLTFVGVLCAGLTVGMYASPLSAMVRLLTLWEN